eukprot:snap_masked-scaffold_4-processed-gene-21.18-mRNA-1 protein AED:0.02 eAED:0.02 QI:0/-1/0/1/-1/1/1/0/64
MHPLLDRPHPDCQEVIKSLQACHRNHAVAKFFGKCNDAKGALDICLRAEKEKRRKENPKFGKQI